MQVTVQKPQWYNKQRVTPMKRPLPTVLQPASKQMSTARMATGQVPCPLTDALVPDI